MPAKPGIAKDLIEADDIGSRLLQTSLTHFYFKKSVFHIPHKMLQLIKF